MTSKISWASERLPHICFGVGVVAAVCYGMRAHRAQIKRLEMLVKQERAGRTKAERKLKQQSQITAPLAGEDEDKEGGASAAWAKPNRCSTAIHYEPIGFVKSVYASRNGTPSTPTRAPSARATIEMLPKALCGNGSLDGLSGYSHLWVIFHFHDNTVGSSAERPGLSLAMSKVLPPRKKDGVKVGVFCCRTPHRPNAIGLSLVRILGVDEKKGLIHISGMDMIDGTPVTDIKPYIPEHDRAMGAEVALPKWCEETSDLTPDFHTVTINQQCKDKLEAAMIAAAKSKKPKLGKLLSIYSGNLDEVYRTLIETARWDGRKRHTKLGLADQWLFRLGDWDFGTKYSGNGEVVVFDCWRQGLMLFDPELKMIVEIDPNNPVHQQHIARQAEEPHRH